MFSKFVTPLGTPRRDDLPRHALVAGRRYQDAASPAECLAEAVHHGYLTGPDHRDRFRRAEGDKYAEMVAFVRDAKVSDALGSMIAPMCRRRGCVHQIELSQKSPRLPARSSGQASSFRWRRGFGRRPAAPAKIQRSAPRSRRGPVRQDRLLAADLLQRQLAAFVIEFLEAVEAVAAIAEHLAGLLSGARAFATWPAAGAATPAHTNARLQAPWHCDALCGTRLSWRSIQSGWNPISFRRVDANRAEGIVTSPLGLPSLTFSRNHR